MIEQSAAAQRAPGALVEVPGVANLRDVGGWPAAGGARVRRGLLYRSVELSRLDEAGVAALGALGLRTVYDLRTGPERDAAPDRLPSGVGYVVADVLADATHLSPARILALLDDPRAASAELSGGAVTTLFQGGYRDIVSSAGALAAYRLMFTSLAEPGCRPALVHCTTGKDRTGWAAAALLMLLGVPDADVMRDYLLTNQHLLPALAPVFDQFEAGGGNPEVLTSVLGVRREYLTAALVEVRSRFGTIEDYFADGLGIDADGQRALRDAFLQPPA